MNRGRITAIDYHELIAVATRLDEPKRDAKLTIFAN